MKLAEWYCLQSNFLSFGENKKKNKKQIQQTSLAAEIQPLLITMNWMTENLHIHKEYFLFYFIF